MSRYNVTTKTSTLSSSVSADRYASLSGNNNKQWDVGNDVLSYCPEDPMGETIQLGMSSVQQGLDGHLPLMHTAQGGLLLGLNETYPVGCHSQSSPAGFLDSGSLDYSDGDQNNAGPLFEKRKRSRSVSSRQRYNETVEELGPEEVRWFYKEDKKTWKPFVGHDSLKVELMYRKHCELNPGAAGSRVGGEQCGNGVECGGLNGAVSVETRTSSVHGGQGSVETSTVSSDDRDPDGIEITVEPVCVRGGLYEVDVKERTCYPVYWKRKYGKTSNALSVLLI